MKSATVMSISAALAIAVALCAFGLHAKTASTAAAQAVSNAAASPPTSRTADDVDQEISITIQSLGKVLSDPVFLSDPAKRSELAPQIIPLAKKIATDMAELAALHPERKKDLNGARIEYLSILSTLGDADASKELATLAASKDSDEMLNGLSGQLETRWMLANMDPALQTPIADELEKLDAIHKESDAFTGLTETFSETAASPELFVRLHDLARKMTSPFAQALNQGMKEEQAAETKLKGNEGKPALITGKDPEGKPFSTADWKGKVILVDFWATWCGPCKAEMPRVKQLYNRYHSKGFEVLGISNDYSADDIKAFVAQEQIPWQQLYDADAGSKENWNPITLGFGIEGIPMMFLIDKKGTIRSVEARQNMEELIPKLLAE
jgi:thiol-disulfide isomerase/thioredoxin